MSKSIRSTLLSPLVEHAIELSAQWHDATYRKGRWRDPAFRVPDEDDLPVPVMAHLTNVAILVQRAGFSETAIAAAFLHDAIEDSNRWGAELRYTELKALIGEDVARYVRVVSERKYNDDGTPKSWQARKEQYLENIQDTEDEVIGISLADKLHNLWSMNEALDGGIDIFSDAPHRRALSAGPSRQLWFFEAILEASRAYSDERLEPLREELAAEIERFRSLTAS